jgi:hypothetical protein
MLSRRWLLNGTATSPLGFFAPLLPGVNGFCYTVELRGMRKLRLPSLLLATLTDSPQNVSENCVGTKKTGKGRRKLGRKKRRMRAKIRHRK